jgi:hypothetical protein
MKALTLALLLSLPVPRFVQSPTAPVRVSAHQQHKGGRWYFAANGHAVYCYGPVRYLPEASGGLMRVATFCRGDQPIVQLKD